MSRLYNASSSPKTENPSPYLQSMLPELKSRRWIVNGRALQMVYLRAHRSWLSITLIIRLVGSRGAPLPSDKRNVGANARAIVTKFALETFFQQPFFSSNPNLGSGNECRRAGHPHQPPRIAARSC